MSRKIKVYRRRTTKEERKWRRMEEKHKDRLCLSEAKKLKREIPF